METELRSVVFVTILHRKLFPLILQDPYIVLHANKSTLANEFRGRGVEDSKWSDAKASKIDLLQALYMIV